MSRNVLVELSDALAEAAERAGKATVQVHARRGTSGSGIAYAADLVLTADHTLERQEDISVTLADGKEVSAKIAGRDAPSDVAVLKLEHSTLQVAETTKAAARPGQIALLLGRLSGNGQEVSLGTVSAIGGPIQTGRGGVLEKYIRTSGISYPGFSGGPLVAADGTVLRLNTSGLASGVAITIPSELAWRTAQLLVQHGRLRRGYLGVRSQAVEISGAAQESLKRAQATGLLIVGVERGGPADMGGLMVGDILMAVAGSPVLQHAELFARLSGEVVGQATPIEILRGGQPQTLNVLIGKKS